MSGPVNAFNDVSPPNTPVRSGRAGRTRRGPPPVSIRFTGAERIELAYRAGRMALGAYIKSVLFAGTAAAYPKRSRVPQADERLLAALLAQIGSSRLASNLNQLAYAANRRTLEVDERTRVMLEDACTDVRQMRAALMDALGVGS